MPHHLHPSPKMKTPRSASRAWPLAALLLCLQFALAGSAFAYSGSIYGPTNVDNGSSVDGLAGSTATATQNGNIRYQWRIIPSSSGDNRWMGFEYDSRTRIFAFYGNPTFTPNNDVTISADFDIGGSAYGWGNPGNFRINSVDTSKTLIFNITDTGSALDPAAGNDGKNFALTEINHGNSLVNSPDNSNTGLSTSVSGTNVVLQVTNNAESSGSNEELWFQWTQDNWATKNFIEVESIGSNAQATIALSSLTSGNTLKWVVASTGPTTSGTISGTTNGLTNFDVIAINKSTPPADFTVPSTPGAPTMGTVTPGNQQLSVAFTAPSSDGGTTITNYEFRTSTDSGTTWSAWTPRSPAATTSPIVITGLTNGTSYIVQIRAVNGKGSGTASGSSAASTPRTTPDAPTIGTITPGNGQLSVAFTAPASNGGSAITDYKWSVDGTNYTTRAGTASPIVITGLLNGTAYTVRIRAVNAAGDGTVATAGSTATPTAGSTAPTVTNGAASSIATTSATLAGDVTSDGGAAVNERGFVYSTSDTTPTIAEGATKQTTTGTTGAMSQSISSLTAGTTYYYNAYAINSVNTAYGTASSFITLTNAPSTPSGEGVTTSNFTASWGSVTGAASYRLDVATDSGFTSFVTNYNNKTISSGTSDNVTGLSAGTTYYVRVRAVNTGGTSANSGTLTQLTVPAAPTTSAATSVDNFSFTANWGSVTGAANYRLDVSTASDFSSNLSGYNNLTVAGTSQSVTGLSPGVTYHYRVRAVNTGGTSGQSGTTSATTALDYSFNITSGTTSNSTVLSGSGNLTKTGAGTLSLSATNTYTGSTTISGGTLALSGSGSIADSSRVNVGASDVFDISAVTTSGTVKILSEIGSGDGGAAKLGSKTLVMNGGAGNTNYYFNNLGVSGDTGSFTMNSPNADTRLNLYGASEYTGTTTVSGGTLITGGTMATTAIQVSGGTFTSGGDNYLSNSATLTVNSGTANINGTDTIANISGSGGTLSILTDKTLTATITGTQSYSGVVSGSGAFVKAGAGTLTFAGSSANTYSGATTVSQGTLILDKDDNVNALAGTPTIAAGATLRLASSNQFVGDSTFLTVTGIFDLNGFNDTLAITGGGTIQLGSGTLTVNPTGSDTFSGSITGAGGIIKTQSGCLTLSGSSDYTGTTAINAGVLQLSHANGLGASGAGQGTTVASNTQLKVYHDSGLNSAEPLTISGVHTDSTGAIRNVGGANTLSGGITLSADSRINATAGSLTLSGLVAAGANTLNIGGNQSLTFSGGISGSKTTGDGAIFIDSVASPSGNITFSGASGSLSGSVNYKSTANSTILLGADTALGTGQFTIEYSGSRVLTIASNGASARTLGNSLTYIYDRLNLGIATTNTGGITFGAVNLGNDPEGSNSKTITTAAGSSHTFGAVGGGATNTLIKAGTGTLTLSASSTTTGGVQLHNGTILVGHNSALGTGTFQVQFDVTGTKTLAASGATDRTLTNNINIYNDFTLGADSVNTGSLTLSGAVHLGDEVNQNRIITVLGTHSLGGVISGARGIVKQGSGTLILPGANTFTGHIYIDDGAVRLAGSLGAGNIEIGAGTGGAAAATLEILSGTYSRPVTVNSDAGAGDRTISFTNTTGTTTLSGAVTLEKSVAVSVASGGTGEFSSTISGNTFGLTKSGAGTLILSGSNSYTGTTTVSAGTLRIPSSNRIADTSAVTLGGGTLQVAGTTSDSMGAFSVSSTGTIDMGSGDADLTFHSLASLTTSLAIHNYTANTDSLTFTNGGWDATSLAKVTFYSDTSTVRSYGAAQSGATIIPLDRTITYNANSATTGSVPASTTHGNGTTATVATNSGSLARTGYAFSGWNTAANGSGTDRAVSSTFTITADTTLYAKWTANTLTVTTDEQGGSAIANASTTTGASMSSPGEPTRAGYTFAGWFTAASGGSAITFPYAHGQTADFTLYAQWTANTLTVTTDEQGGSSIANTSTTTGGTVADPGTPTRSGFTFNGWFTAASGGSAISFPYTHGQTADFTLYAQWSASAPAQVTLSRADTAVADGFTVKWSDVANETGYHLNYSTNSTFASSVTEVTNIAANATSYAISGLTPGTIYYVRVRGVSAGGNGTWSNTQVNQLRSIAAGATAYLAPAGTVSANTVAGIFGTSNEAGLASSTTPAGSTVIMLLNDAGGTANTIFYHSSSGWLEGATPMASTAMPAGKAFMVKNNTVSTDYFLLNAEPRTAPVTVSVNATAGQVNLLTPARSVPTALNALGLTSGNNTSTGIKQNTAAKQADMLIIQNTDGVHTSYHFDGTNWRSNRSIVSDPSAISVPAGGAFFIRKAEGSNFNSYTPPAD